MKPINRIFLLLILSFAILSVGTITSASDRVPCAEGSVAVSAPTVRQGEQLTVTFSVTNCDVRTIRNVDMDLFVYYACPDSEGNMNYGQSIVEMHHKMKMEARATDTATISFIAPVPVPCGDYVACLWLTTPHALIDIDYAYFTITE
jgi:hypothetical protein